MARIPKIPNSRMVVDPLTGEITKLWEQFFRDLASQPLGGADKAEGLSGASTAADIVTALQTAKIAS